MRRARTLLMCVATLGLVLVGATSSKAPTPRMKWEQTPLRDSIGRRARTLGHLRVGTACEVLERSGEWVSAVVHIPEARG